MQEEAVRCRSCDAVVTGTYCGNCGEKLFRKEDLAFLPFVKTFIRSLTEVDGKFILTLRALAFSPGELTHAFVTGTKKKYITPFALFALLNFLFFFVQPLGNLNTFNSTLHAQMYWHPYSASVERKVNEYLAASGEQLETFAKRYNAISEQYAKTFVGFQIPFSALLVWILQARKKRFFVEHVIFSTHFYSMFLLFDIFMTLTILGLLRPFHLSFNLEYYILFLFVVYYAFALRKVYAEGWIWGIVKAVVLSGGFVVVLMGYRYVLFIATFYSI